MQVVVRQVEEQLFMVDLAGIVRYFWNYLVLVACCINFVLLEPRYLVETTIVVLVMHPFSRVLRH